MTTYYRDGAVRVTGTLVEVGDRAIPISELRYVWHQKGRPTLRTASRRAARLGLIAVLTVPLLAGAAVAANLIAGDQGMLVWIGLAVILLAGGSLLLLLLAPLLEFPLMALERSYDRGSSVWEIWVRRHGQDVMLLRTSDAARFGQIYRAIQRAVEQLEEA